MPETEPYRAGGSYYVPLLATNRVTFQYQENGNWTGTREAIVNPTTLTEAVEPQYSRRPVLGLSHEISQYIRTASRTISFDLWYCWHVYLQRKGFNPDEHPLAFRNYFAAFVVPNGATKAPPLVSVEWPGVELSFKGYVSSYSVKYDRFSNTGVPIEYTIGLAFVEIPSGLMTSKLVRAYGLGSNAVDLDAEGGG